MPPLSHPLRFLLVALAGWIHQQQRDAIDYLQEERIAVKDRKTNLAMLEMLRMTLAQMGASDRTLLPETNVGADRVTFLTKSFSS